LFAFDDPKNWEEHALEGEFGGAAFDGKYVYFASREAMTVWRYDTARTFVDAAAWEVVELLDSGIDRADGFVGAASDRSGNVYLTTNVRAYRHGPGDAFTTAGWKSFGLASIPRSSDAGAGKLDVFGVVAHGAYLFFVPHRGDAVTYALGGDFESVASWARVSLPWSDARFAGSVSTSAGLYLVPANFSLTRVDNGTIGPESFTTGGLVRGNFLGGTTDGKSVFVVPADAPTAPMFPVGRSPVDEELPTSFSLEGLAQCSVTGCFAGAVFDGRYVYYVPAKAPRFVRHDTEDPHGFADPSSWSVRDSGAAAADFFGGAFDGRYVYFVPAGAGKVVRFHAREPSAMPPSYSGSFL
jgi:hypothetical protein